LNENHKSVGRSEGMNDKNYDPKLRTAMKEIEEILKKYDIGATITLQSEKHAEFKMFVETSWSLARFIRDGDAFHIKLYNSRQPQLDWTAGMIYSMRDLSALFFQQTEQIIKKIEEHSKVDHKIFGLKGITNEDRE
jgi:hypothetical protein